jgi:Na+/proline symporter
MQLQNQPKHYQLNLVLYRAGAISGMVAGAVVVIVWISWIKPLATINAFFGMYEIPATIPLIAPARVKSFQYKE